MVQFSNSWALAMAIAIVPNIQKLDLFRSRHFCPDFKWFYTKWRPDFKSHLNSRPFATQPLFDHSKSILGFQTCPDFRSPLYLKSDYRTFSPIINNVLSCATFLGPKSDISGTWSPKCLLSKGISNLFPFCIHDCQMFI